jgi:hypothetical protein
MFKMIGGDGQEYGPVTAEQLRDWILDHRANGQTLVQRAGQTQWQPLAACPEFAEALAEAARRYEAPAAAASPPEEAAAPAAVAATSAAASPGRFGVLDCVGRGWGLLQRHMLLVLWASFLVWVIPTVLTFFGFPIALAAWVISGPLYGGLCVLVLKLARGQEGGFRDVWSCFDARFVSCVLVWVFTEAVTQLGLMMLLVPGIFLATVWAFSLPLAADRGADLATALRESWRVVTPRFFRVLGLLALAFLPFVVFYAYTLGVTAHWVMELMGPGGITSLSELLNRWPEFSRRGAVLGLQLHTVFGLNLPFAWVVLMTAYEDLFSAGRA